MEKENIVVTFSGGRTSGFKCEWLKDNLGHLYNFYFVFTNTGLEHEKTLEFVNKCDKHFNLNLVWLEAVIYHGKEKSSGHKIVSFETASRKGEPFKELIKKYGLVNQDFFHCTRDLKERVIDSYIRDFNNGFLKGCRRTLGIRYDEFQRVKNRKDIIYPLATIAKFTKEEILNWWKKQPFDLEIEEHYGNCVGCYKKSDKKLKMIADENPHYFDFFIDMEKQYSFVKSKNENEPRITYRHFRTAYEVKNNLKLPDTLTLENECAEECGSVIVDFESPKVEDMNYQKNLLDLMQ